MAFIIKFLTLKIHAPARGMQGRMGLGAAPQPELLQAPTLVPQADAAPAPDEMAFVEATMAVPEAPSARAVADAVYRMMVEDAKRARLRRGS